jgi:hypothetical protein
MGSTFADLDEFFSPGLTLTIKGREYTVPLASGELGLWCRRTAEVAGAITESSGDAEVASAVAAAQALPDPPGADRLTLHQRVLGEDLYQQMLNDGLPDAYVVFAGLTAYVWIVGGEEAAQRYWETGGRPEQPSPANREERRALHKTGGAMANATRTPGSSSGTRSRRRSGRAGR